MPTWFIILMGSLFFVGAVGISVAVVVARRILSKVDKLFAETKRDDALVHDKCMIRDGAIQMPWCDPSCRQYLDYTDGV